MTTLNKTDIEKFEKFTTNVMDTYSAQGLAVSLFGMDDTYYENFFGYKDTQNKLDIDADTIFGLASISKSFTCLALLQLAERGIVDLERRVSDYIPEFSGKHQKDVRLKHLMSHSAGFFPEKRILARDVAKEMGIWNESNCELAYNEELAIEGIKRVAERLDSRDKLIGRPDELMSYSNDSYGLISDIVRRYGGHKSFAEYINENIFKPLGMTRSTLEFVAPAKDDNTSQLYIRKDGKIECSKDFYDNAFVLMGGGAIKSTITDLKKYTRMFLSYGVGESGKEVLGSYYVKEMFKPKHLYRFQQHYGYGLSTQFTDDITVIGHGGSLTGVSSMFQWSKELGVGVLVLCNTSEVPVGVIADAAMKLAMGKDPDVQSQPYTQQAWDKETVNAAVGRYESAEGIVVEIVCEGNELTLEFNGTALKTRQARGDILLIDRPHNTADLILCRNVKGEVWGIRVGARIIPKA